MNEVTKTNTEILNEKHILILPQKWEQNMCNVANSKFLLTIQPCAKKKMLLYHSITIDKHVGFILPWPQ